MAAENVDVFLNRAQDFARGMGLIREEPTYAQSAALLAIHSAIAYTDALRLGLGDRLLSSDDHNSAIRALRSLVGPAENDGIAKLQNLLMYKSAISYGNRRTDTKRLQLLCTDSQRYARWANKIGAARVPGWRLESD